MMQKSNHIKYVAAAAVLVFIWFVFQLGVSEPTKKTMDKLKPGSWGKSTAAEQQSSQNLLEGLEAREYCKRHHFEPFDSARVGKRKIYDLLLVNTELEMLEVRMGQMYPYVDYFIILESDKTFTDKPKSLYIQENWDLFKPYHDKMIRKTMDLEKLQFDGGAWDREHKSRNAMYDQVIPYLKGDQAASIDDILLVSDVDEIPKPDVLKALRNCQVPQRVSIHADFYYYSFQWLSRENWGHPQATTYQGDDTVLPEDLRGNANDYHFQHGAWHCSYCFSTMGETVKKVESFSHQEYNTPEYKDPAKILNRVRFGTDFFDRESNVYDYIDTNHDIPSFLKHNADRFMFMLDRNPANANYRDVPANGDVSGLKKPQ